MENIEAKERMGKGNITVIDDTKTKRRWGQSTCNCSVGLPNPCRTSAEGRSSEKSSPNAAFESPVYLRGSACDPASLVRSWSDGSVPHLLYAMQPGWTGTHRRKLPSSFLKISKLPTVFRIYANNRLNRRGPLTFPLFSLIFPSESVLQWIQFAHCSQKESIFVCMMGLGISVFSSVAL